MCCGRSRPSLSSMGRVSRPQRSLHSTATQPASPAAPVVYFQYNGRTSMTVIGPVSGTVYRFLSPGRRVVVDLRDRPSLAAISQLAEVYSL